MPIFKFETKIRLCIKMLIPWHDTHPEQNKKTSTPSKDISNNEEKPPANINDDVQWKQSPKVTRAGPV